MLSPLDGMVCTSEVLSIDTTPLTKSMLCSDYVLRGWIITSCRVTKANARWHFLFIFPSNMDAVRTNYISNGFIPISDGTYGKKFSGLHTRALYSFETPLTSSY